MSDTDTPSRPARVLIISALGGPVVETSVGNVAALLTGRNNDLQEVHGDADTGEIVDAQIWTLVQDLHKGWTGTRAVGWWIVRAEVPSSEPVIATVPWCNCPGTLLERTEMHYETCAQYVWPALARDVAEGQVFSVDGREWHVCAVNNSAMGTIAVYVDDTRDDESPTVRVDVPAGSSVLRRVALP